MLADWSTDDVDLFADLMHRFNTSSEEYSKSKVPGSDPQPSPVSEK